MSLSESTAPDEDPFDVLGLSPDATEEAIRARYLSLVRVHPPERDPKAFQRIAAAYQAAKDPTIVAAKLLDLPDEDDPPTWEQTIRREASQPPRMSPTLLSSLGNRTSQT